MNSNTLMLDAALAYAAKGWPVFPCSPENKQPLTPGETSRGAKDGGLYLATTDEQQIRAWWTRWPKAMIGLPTGARSGAFVIDLDPKAHSADVMLQGLADWLGGGALPLCPLSRTQSGGLHLLFALSAEPLGNRAGLFRHIPDAPAEIREHVDTRGDGGYIIVPPSVMATGKAYAWEQDPADYDLPAMPQRLVDAVAKRLDDKGRGDHSGDVTNMVNRPAPSADERVTENRRKYALSALMRETDELARMLQGGRNDALNKAAFSLGCLVGAGILSESTARAELFDAATRNGLVKDDGRASVLKTIDSGMGDGIASPIDLSQIGTRVGTSRQGARLAGASRPQSSSASPTPTSPAPAPSGDAQSSSGSQWGGRPPDRDGQGGAGGDSERGNWDRKKLAWRFARNVTCSQLPLTDLGNAQRFVERFGKKFFYVEQWGWLAWDGKRWNGTEAEAILQRAVHMTIKGISFEARVVRQLGECFDRCGIAGEGEKLDPDAPGDSVAWNPLVDVKKGQTKADRISGWAISSQSNAHITCIARLAQAYLTATPDQFDVDLCAFNVNNGTLRFKKTDDGSPYVSFSRHSRDDMMTKLSGVDYLPEAQAPIYDAFLAKVQPDAPMRRHLHAWGGVSLTGLPLARMAFWYGKGRNGKSTCIDAWAFVIGEYSQTIPIESFLDQGRSRRGSEASPDIASLPGVRCLRTSEPEKGAQLAESLVKLVTGGEPLRARHLNKDFFEFRPAFKLTMQGNYRPNVTGTDEGFWRRMLLVPWGVTIGEDEVDVNLPDRLKAEASGILNRLLDGLCDYLDHGVSPTAEIIDATASYRDDSDPVGRFLKECTITVPPSVDEQGKKHESRVGGKELYETYVAWARAEGEKPWQPKGFSRGLQDHGIRRLKSSGIYYLGITLIKFAAEFEGMEIEVADDRKYKKKPD